jgi:hypothetical protein
LNKTINRKKYFYAAMAFTAVTATAQTEIEPFAPKVPVTYIGDFEGYTPGDDIPANSVFTAEGDYVGNNQIVAGDSIRIKNGFYAEVGSKFHAYIHPLECTVSGGGSSAMILPGSNNEQIENNSLVTLDLKVEEKIDFKVYPNPSEGQFTIEFSDQTEYFKVQILNLSGEVIYTNEFISNKLINLSLATGVYFVKVESADKVQLKKIIIK